MEMARLFPTPEVTDVDLEVGRVMRRLLSEHPDLCVEDARRNARQLIELRSRSRGI